MRTWSLRVRQRKLLRRGGPPSAKPTWTWPTSLGPSTGGTSRLGAGRSVIIRLAAFSRASMAARCSSATVTAAARTSCFGLRVRVMDVVDRRGELIGDARGSPSSAETYVPDGFAVQVKFATGSPDAASPSAYDLDSAGIILTASTAYG